MGITCTLHMYNLDYLVRTTQLYNKLLKEQLRTEMSAFTKIYSKLQNSDKIPAIITVIKSPLLPDTKAILNL